jgi:acyl carrier protein
MDYEAAVKKIVSEKLGVAYESVKGNLMDDIGADSLDLVELVMELEEEFDIEIPDNIAEELLTFEQIVDYISKNAS